jgi:hypothetical protein
MYLVRSNFGGLLLTIRWLINCIKNLRYILTIFNYEIKSTGTDTTMKQTVSIEESMESAIPLWKARPFCQMLAEKVKSSLKGTPITSSMNEKLYWNLITFRISILIAFVPVFIGLLGSFFVDFTLCSGPSNCRASSLSGIYSNGKASSITDFDLPCSAANATLLFDSGGCERSNRSHPVVDMKNCILSNAITSKSYIRYPRSWVEVALFSLFAFCCLIFNAFEENEKVHSSVAISRNQICDPYAWSKEKFFDEIGECFNFYRPVASDTESDEVITFKLLHGAFTRLNPTFFL